jgi:hypothetical protein
MLSVAWLVGPTPIVQLGLGGAAGLLGYLLIAVPPNQIRGLRARLRPATT